MRERVEKSNDETRTAPAPRRGSSDRATDHVLSLQKSAGNGAVASAIGRMSPENGVIQRVNIVDRMQGTTKAQLGDQLDALKEFHDTLVDMGKVNTYLTALESAVKDALKQHDPNDPRRHTKALTEVLATEEASWMNQDQAPVDDTHSGKGAAKISVEAGVLDPAGLVKILEERRPLKDVGAAISHGEYAHRVQMWIFSRWAQETGRADQRALLFGKLLVRDVGALEEDEEKIVPGGPGGPVWSWVLDIPAGDVRFHPEEVGAAAPANVTTGITKVGHEGKRPTPITGVYDKLRRAFLARRIKRHAQAKAQQKALVEELNNQLDERQVNLSVQQKKTLTTPSFLFSEETFTEIVKDLAIVQWARERHYWSWMRRTDLAMQTALKGIGRGDFMEPPLGPNATEEEKKERAQARAEIVKLLAGEEQQQ